MVTECEDMASRPEASDQATVDVTPTMVLDHLARRLPQFQPTAAPVRISGGYLNYLWRVQGEPSSVIVKVTLPHIAAMPQVPLDQHRLDIEARSLAAFEPGGTFNSVGSPAMRPPRPLDFDEPRHILVIEDLGQVPHLGTWFGQGRADWAVGQLLGQFIGALHARTYGDKRIAQDYDNSAIQCARLRLHYSAVGNMCRKAGLPGADELGEKAIALGEQLQMPGACVIQGDLWPPSILITASGVRVIDWEFTHFGHPAQDVGHLAAHLWMYAHRPATQEAADRARASLGDFLRAYRSALGAEHDAIFGTLGMRQSAIHFGAEILMRTVGAFQDGYLYDGLPVNDRSITEAVHVAARHIRSPEQVDTFDELLL